MLRSHIMDPHELFSFIVSADEAAAYCQSIGMKVFWKKWHDKKVIVSICLISAHEAGNEATPKC